MKLLILALILPFSVAAQYVNDQKIGPKARVETDSGTFKGYFISGTDSTIMLSPTKRYYASNYMNIRVDIVKDLRIKQKRVPTFGSTAGCFALGFLLTAGLTQNPSDVDDDGKTSFWELMFAAIKGSTSSDRQRRKSALLVGAGGGTAAALLSLLGKERLHFVFPLNDRRFYYNDKRGEINKFAKF